MLNAEEIWADFDALLEGVKMPLNERVDIVKRIAYVCCQQVEYELSRLRSPLSDLDIYKDIEKRYKLWREINHKILNL